MGTGIDGEPNTYDAGLDFDYSVWTAGTRIDLVNVPWNNDYRDVVKFIDRQALNTYIDGLQSAGIRIDGLTYAKPGQDIYINIPHNRANRFNYLRASNDLMPIENDLQKDYYYFIIDTEFVAPNTTRLRLQLDVWQSYVYDVLLGNCYIERGHIGIANANNFNNYGRDYLTIPEGIDVGSEYRIIERRSETLIKNNIVSSSDQVNGDIVVVSAVDIQASGGTAEAPELVTASGSQINGMPSGADFYVFESVAAFTNFMNSIADKPWVSQGIISVTYMPSVTRYGSTPTGDEKVIQLITLPIKHAMNINWRDDILNAVPERYRTLKKFLTSPYMMIELTTWTGNPAILKPESWNNANAEVMERASFVPPNQRVEFIPKSYNAVNGAEIDNLYDLTDAQVAAIPAYASYLTEAGDDGGEYLDVTVTIRNFPSLPIVNDMAISYLASNANTIPYQFSAADWTQQRALGMASGQYDIATGAAHNMMNQVGSMMNADIAQTANVNRTQAAQAIVNSANAGVTGIGNAITPSGFLGSAISGTSQAITTGVNAGIGIASNDEALGIRNRQAVESLVSNDKQNQLVRDTNKQLADWAAKGDYASSIAGINAKVRDAALTQPSVSGQFSGEAHQIATNKMEFSIRWKMIDLSAIRVIGEYWLRYGYAIRAFINVPPSLMVMSNFTYWKLSETYITSGNIPEGFKQAIRGIFEKGVTVWADPAKLGRIDLADNTPLSGVSY